MVAVPRTPEQRTTADRLVELGLGRSPAPAEATPDRLREAVRDAGGAPRAADVIEARLAPAAATGAC
ncbi:hypothetical protein [Actinomadura sp. NEAU-AAG7]|uniref:hypothetical protein n=1 Tax=Actinomadura sp. NEAU-AAG7 TaxID=2839640 RepID=UPI001BE3D536|nr:hypothetical protein [Actinomadura sp. NEAU-AAG7]MBT2210355.1 hypothetical protein [Actinomadura sp. NEAU-AAG7]